MTDFELKIMTDAISKLVREHCERAAGGKVQPTVVTRQTIMNAARWNKLIKLCGYWQDHSNVTIKFTQDDATQECLIFVGEEVYTGGGFEAIIDRFA